jgi:hypothetical protein
MAKHVELSDDLQEQITAAIIRSQRIDEVILRGHLYVEHCLNELILVEWSDKGRKLVERFTFDQKIAILEGTRLLPDELALNCLRGLIKLRNHISHTLFPSNLEEQVMAIESLIGNPSGHTETPLYRAKMIVISLCVSIVARTNGKKGGSEFPQWLLEIPRESH